MIQPIAGDEMEVLDFDDGNWIPRLLPVYDVMSNLLHPMYYGSLAGSLVSVSVIAMSKVDHDTRVCGCFWQVRKMEVLRIGCSQ